MRAANVMTNTTRRVLSGTRSGELRRKPHAKRKYRASAPGEAPAVRTGILRRSFQRKYYIRQGNGKLTVYAISESGLKTGKYLLPRILNEGTRRMAARPFVKKVKQEALPEVQRIYNEPYQV